MKPGTAFTSALFTNSGFSMGVEPQRMPTLPRDLDVKTKVTLICDAGDVHNDRLRAIRERSYSASGVGRSQMLAKNAA